jgi:DNA-binding NarL/FixJ family response regulator
MKTIIFEKNKVIRNTIKLIIDDEKVLFTYDFDHLVKMLKQKKIDTLIINSNYNGNFFSEDSALQVSLLKKAFPKVKILVYSAFHQLRRNFKEAGADNFSVMGDASFCLSSLCT